MSSVTLQQYWGRNRGKGGEEKEGEGWEGRGDRDGEKKGQREILKQGGREEERMKEVSLPVFQKMWLVCRRL